MFYNKTKSCERTASGRVSIGYYRYETANMGLSGI